MTRPDVPAVLCRAVFSAVLCAVCVICRCSTSPWMPWHSACRCDVASKRLNRLTIAHSSSLRNELCLAQEQPELWCLRLDALLDISECQRFSNNTCVYPAVYLLQAQLALMEVAWPEGLIDDSSAHSSGPATAASDKLGFRHRSVKGRSSKGGWPRSAWSAAPLLRLRRSSCRIDSGQVPNRVLSVSSHSPACAALILSSALPSFSLLLTSQHTGAGGTAGADRKGSSLLPSGPSGWLRKSRPSLKQSGTRWLLVARMLGCMCIYVCACVGGR